VKLREGWIIAVILAVFLLAAALILVLPGRHAPFIPDPGTGVPGEKLKYREEAIAFVRENEALLHRVMHEVNKFPGDVDCVDLSRFVDMETYDAPVLRGDFMYVLENEYLKSTLENTILDQLNPGRDVWKFSLDFSSGIATSSRYYDIICCAQDPAPHIEPVSGGAWQDCGNGRLYTRDHVKLYLEEIGNGFWYSYIFWP